MTDTATQLAVDSVEFVKELYPRLREDDAAIERYRASIELLPPIAVARGHILVDGFHRLQAHKREKRDTIAAIDLGNLADAEIRRESISRNATHGQQLSQADKRRLAGILWRDFATLKNGERVSEIAELLSVSKRALEVWTHDARATEKAEQQTRAWELWLDCMTQERVADETGMSQPEVSRLIQERRDAFLNSPPESRQHFDIWEFQKADGASSYFGKMPPQVVENLLWLYTEPGQIVVDPFAGGGTTIDVAKQMGRRVWASDLHPSTPTLPIHAHDITTGWPSDAPSRSDLVLLDPPYWQQAKGRYSDDPSDMANMTLDQFRQAWAQVMGVCKSHIRNGGYLAFIISPSVNGVAVKTGGEIVVDHAFEMCGAAQEAGFHMARRVIVPYQTQQANGAEVVWARENRRLLKLYRDLVVLQA